MSKIPDLHLPLYPSGILSVWDSPNGLGLEAVIPNVVVDLSMNEEQALRLKDYLEELYG